MRTIKKRNRKVAVLGAILLTLGMGAAYAYWTAGGSGTGTAATGDTVAVTAVQTSVITDLRPGDTPQTLSGDFDNTNTATVYVSTVTASIASVDKAPGAPAGTCGATDYTLANSVMTVNAEIAPGSGVGAWTGATIQFNDKVTNQDACKGATVNLAYTIA